jgi:ATP-dependent RNA helicase RhlB
MSIFNVGFLGLGKVLVKWVIEKLRFIFKWSGKDNFRKTPPIEKSLRQLTIEDFVNKSRRKSSYPVKKVTPREFPLNKNQEKTAITPEREKRDKSDKRDKRDKGLDKKKWTLSEFAVPPSEGKARFHDMNLPDSLMHAIHDLGFQYCTPIQAELLPGALKGRDAIGQAQTGTGKSAAFLISIFVKLLEEPLNEKRKFGTPRVLILAPTRELVLQIEKDTRDIGKYTGISSLSVFGGMNFDQQKKKLETSVVDIVAATPGRLLDFKHRKILDLSRVEVLVIDEADRMLDMGFIPDIKEIVYSTPPKANRQTMFFSATINDDVLKLAGMWTRDSFSIAIEPEKVAADSIDQIMYMVASEDKFRVLYNLIKNRDKVLIFTNRKDQARRLQERMDSHAINCELLSGDVSQKKRIKVLEGFRDGGIKVLVATDVAARGLHVEGISHVINFNLPENAEHYVHRIGRTGRAGMSGTSISFACEEDSYYIPDIEAFLGRKLRFEHPEDSLMEPLPKPVKRIEGSRSRTNNRQRKGSAGRSDSRGDRGRRDSGSRRRDGRNKPPYSK